MLAAFLSATNDLVVEGLSQGLPNEVQFLYVSPLKGAIMYPVRLGYSVAVTRINNLLKNEHDAEALVTSVFTAKKHFGELYVS